MCATHPKVSHIAVDPDPSKGRASCTTVIGTACGRNGVGDTRAAVRSDCAILLGLLAGRYSLRLAGARIQAFGGSTARRREWPASGPWPVQGRHPVAGIECRPLARWRSFAE